LDLDMDLKLVDLDLTVAGLDTSLSTFFELSCGQTDRQTDITSLADVKAVQNGNT